MAEDKIKKQNPEELQDEQLDKVAGGLPLPQNEAPLNHVSGGSF